MIPLCVCLFFSCAGVAIHGWDRVGDGGWGNGFVRVGERRLERSVASQALRTFCVFWRRGWAGETEETKLSLFALLRQGVNEGGFAAVRKITVAYSKHCLLMTLLVERYCSEQSSYFLPTVLLP